MGNHQLQNGAILTVQQASPADAAEILQFIKMASGETDFLLTTPEEFSLTTTQERAYLERQAALPRSATLAGRVDGRVGAIASVDSPPRRRAAHTGELSILVAKVLWGQGVATAMLGELLAFARAAGLRLAHLGVRGDNTRAIALYERLGFVEVGRLPGYFLVDGRYHDEVLMAMVLS